MIRDMSFGSLFKAIRMKNNQSMRQYCLKRGLDTGNISKLERNLISPPNTRRQLLKYLEGLKYDPLDFDFLITAAQNFHIARTNKRFEEKK